MLYLMMTTSFKDVVETYKVALDISIGIGNTISYTCLSSEIYNNRDIVFCEDLIYCFFVCNRGVYKSPVPFQSLYFFQTFILDVDIIVIGNRINTYHFNVLHIVEKTLHKVAANKTSSTCHQNRLPLKINIIIYHKRP